MSKCSHTHEQLAERKPPKSGPARMATRLLEYARALRSPMAAIRAEVRRGIVERGIFDHLLTDEDVPRSLRGQEQLAFDPADLTPHDFRYTDSAQAHDEFMQWLREQHEQGVLTVISRDDNIYVRRALADGDRWAVARLRESGIAVEAGALPTEAFALSRQARGYAVPTFNRPMDASAVRLLFQRNYDQLEGITSDVSSQVGRVLSEGLSQGHGPQEVARNIADRIDSVGRTRSTLVARNELMLAHNTSARERYKANGVERVRILGSDPCDECDQYVGNVYPIDDIPKGGPPFHPRCVGTVSPILS